MAENTSIDRISNLPEPVICHVLSFLPPRDAVKTTLLSTKFSNLWKDVRTLSFSHHEDNNQELRNFVGFVNKLFSVLETRTIDVLSIQLGAFSLSHNDIIRGSLRSWVSVSVAKHVKRVELINGCGIVLPTCIFTCNSLQILQLTNIIVKLNGSSLVCLPNLRILSLADVRIRGGAHVDKLISGCSSLHTLFMRIRGGDDDDDVDKFSVCSPTLEDLTIVSSHEYLPSWPSMLDIDTPALKYLHLRQTRLKNLLIKTSSRLVEAEIFLGTARCGLRTNLSDALSNVNLWFFDDFENGLEHLGHSIVWPMIPNLTSLTVLNFSDQFDILKDLLQKLPSLVTLDLDCTYCKAFSSLEDSDVIPGYMSSTLKMVKVNNFYGTIGQLKVLEYILLNASLLETVKIKTDKNCRKKFESCRDILKFQRKSKYCRIEFD